MRIKIIRVILWLAFLAIFSDLFYLQILRGNHYFNLSAHNRIRVVPLEARRGTIRDRNGIVLAENRLTFHVAVVPQDIKDKEALFEFLSRVLKAEKNIIRQRFWLQREAPFLPVVIAEDVDKQTAMIIEENRFRFPGLYMEEVYERFYPFGPVGAHVLGYIGKISRGQVEKMKDYGYSHLSVVGKSGIEEYYDAYLRGTPGGLQIEVDSRGRQVRLLSLREPQDGKDIQLTIDQRIQDMAAKLLNEKRGAVVVMNLESGEILGMVSSPFYNPNIFLSHQEKEKAAIFTNPHAPLLNRSIKGLYPPGSVFKTAVALAGLATNKLSVHSSFTCRGGYSLGRRTFRCLHTHGVQDLSSGLANSCNVYFFNAGELLGPELMHKYALLLGLGEKTQIDLPSENKGWLPHPLQNKLKFKKSWHKGDTLNFAIGQGDTLVTPLQLLQMMATVGRKGFETQPHLIHKINDQEIVKFATVRAVGIPEETIGLLQSALRLVITAGTARLLDLPEFTIYGKTGTAQVGKSSEDHAWFVGYETSGKIKVAFCIFLEQGGASYNAVAMAKELLLKMRSESII